MLYILKLYTKLGHVLGSKPPSRSVHFSYTCVVLEKKTFENWLIFAPLLRPGGDGRTDDRVLKFTIDVGIVPKMLRAKIEKNWSGSYQD